MRALWLVALVLATAAVGLSPPALVPAQGSPVAHSTAGAADLQADTVTLPSGPPGSGSANRADVATHEPAGVPEREFAPASAGENRSRGAIVAVYPDPVTRNDRGEYVVVEYPPGAGWSLSDGETRIGLPGGAPRVVVTADREAVAVDGEVVAASDLRLANGGETLRLRHGDTVVDEVTYERASEGEILRPASDEWRPLGATDLSPVETGPARATVFVLPDAPGAVARTIRSADRRVLLGGYTFSSWRVARALVAARERGASVGVLVDGGPVGGLTRRQARVLDWLVHNGVSVEVLAGPRARYDFHHAKYAVVDDRALVLTENYKPAGTGGRSSRGWGVVLDDPAAAAHLADVFRADTGWRDTVTWSAFRANRSFDSGGVANGSYPSRFPPREVPVERARVLVAPDNAESGIVAAVRGADESLLVQQVSIGGPRQPFLRAAVEAARRGVRVRLLLSSAWYVREDNRRLVDRLNGLADSEGLPLTARLAEPRSRYGKIHAKGAVIDEETVVLGSVNWNNHSARENREVAVILEGDAVGSYYARAFQADWRGGTRRVPVGVVGVVVLAATCGLRAARRVPFERG